MATLLKKKQVSLIIDTLETELKTLIPGVNFTVAYKPHICRVICIEWYDGITQEMMLPLLQRYTNIISKWTGKKINIYNVFAMRRHLTEVSEKALILQILKNTSPVYPTGINYDTVKNAEYITSDMNYDIKINDTYLGVALVRYAKITNLSSIKELTLPTLEIKNPCK